MAEIVSLKEISEILNMDEDEIKDMARKGEIPHLKYANGMTLKFPKEEVLRKITPRPEKKKPAETKESSKTKVKVTSKSK
jgi:hypothetical protein